nr:Acyltransferase [Leptospira interrogans serovar Copenhageni/Icterohaemorrhagiae]
MNPKTRIEEQDQSDQKYDDSEPGVHPGSSLRVRKILRWFGKIYGSLFYKTEVIGLENVPQKGKRFSFSKTPEKRRYSFGTC